MKSLVGTPVPVPDTVENTTVFALSNLPDSDCNDVTDQMLLELQSR